MGPARYGPISATANPFPVVIFRCSRTYCHLRVGLDPLPNLDHAMAIRDTVARLISDVCAGSFTPGIAAGLARG